MDSTRPDDPKVLAHYEGLIFRTAQILREPTRHGPPVQLELDDIRQILWIKVVTALRAFDPARMRRRRETVDDARDRYVFMCITSQSIDLRNRRRRRDESYIEDEASGPASDDFDKRDSFDARYLATSHEQVYGHLEEDGVLVPSTLGSTERAIVVGLYAGWKQTEIAEQLGLEKREIEKAMRSIRAKMADWNPGLADTSSQLELQAA